MTNLTKELTESETIDREKVTVYEYHNNITGISTVAGTLDRAIELHNQVLQTIESKGEN